MELNIGLHVIKSVLDFPENGMDKREAEVKLTHFLIVRELDTETSPSGEQVFVKFFKIYFSQLARNQGIFRDQMESKSKNLKR